MRKFLYLSAIVLGGLVLIGTILVLHTQYKILNRGKEVAEEYIKSEQKRLNMECKILRTEFKNFVDNKLQYMVQNENYLIKGENNIEDRDMVKLFYDKLSKCSELYEYDKYYEIGETGNLEFVNDVRKEYLEIYTLITYPENDSTCNEVCRKEKMVILGNAYNNLHNLLR